MVIALYKELESIQLCPFSKENVEVNDPFFPKYSLSFVGDSTWVCAFPS
jgi:hypothetical protein